MASLPKNIKCAFEHSPRVEVAGIYTERAVGARLGVRPLDQCSLVAFLARVEEVLTAIVAAETDPLHKGPLSIPKGPRYQATGPSIPEYPLHLATIDPPLAGAASIDIHEHETDIMTRASAPTPCLTATAVRDPVLSLSFHQLSGLIHRTHVVHRTIRQVHSLLPARSATLSCGTLATAV
jgi:hypothetical protein